MVFVYTAAPFTQDTKHPGKSQTTRRGMLWMGVFPRQTCTWIWFGVLCEWNLVGLVCLNSSPSQIICTKNIVSYTSYSSQPFSSSNTILIHFYCTSDKVAFPLRFGCVFPFSAEKKKQNKLKVSTAEDTPKAVKILWDCFKTRFPARHA